MSLKSADQMKLEQEFPDSTVESSKASPDHNSISPDHGNSGKLANQPPSLSKRALKRKARAEKFKEKKKQKAANSNTKDDAGYNREDLNETSYYFENGLRKVYPYPYVFATHAKGRWVGRTLRSVLEKEFGFRHPSDIDKAFEDKKIWANSKNINSGYVIKDCDYISHQTHRHENPVTDAPIEVLENNDELIVVNKPSSIPCHPCGRYRYNSLVFILGKEMGCSNLRNIYRLDRLTSGVLIMGKTTKMTKRLEDQVMNRQVQKEYVCRVTGEFPSESLTVDQPLKALSNKLRLQVVSPQGKPSQTTFQRLSFNGRSSVVRCIPHTGRTHQIRVHLQYLGHPILNDVFYNSDAWGPDKGKGGDYQVSHDVTCDRIYRMHQATLWEGEDNPLYYNQLKQDHQDESKVINAMDEISHGDQSETNDISVSDSTSGAGGRLINGKASHTDSSKFPPLTGLSIDKGEEERPLENDLQQRPTSSTSVPIPKTNCEDAAASSRPPYEPSKWVVDMSCALCRKTTVDPQPKDLVMFLHALKYKGPGWAFETKLPDWAQEDWNKEDEFMVESSLQFEDDPNPNTKGNNSL